MSINKLSERAKRISPVLRIGKNGLSDNVIIEIKKLLKKRKLIKIKILNNCPVEDKDMLIQEIVAKSDSILVSKVGFVFVIYKN